MSNSNQSLIHKVDQLQHYLNQQYPLKKLMIHSFIHDLKSITPNLSILAILNHLVAMYHEGLNTSDIVKDVDKTKKVFKIAREYIKKSENDSTIILLSKQIHDIIINHIEKALELYKKEFDLSSH